jgi:acetyltransferase-like isoleucine patch superfamily enzyme/cytochrome c-type biogenesis protein CcmH/NrfG
MPPHTPSISLDPGLTLDLGEHSFIQDQRIRNPSGAPAHIRIGRFCSIAADLTVIGCNPHSEWITLYPFLDEARRVGWPGTEGLPAPQDRPLGTHGSRGEIHIGSDVSIGYGVRLFKGITIGDGAVIGACALVTRSIEPYTVVAGVPARPLRKRFGDEDIAYLKTLRWWDWPDAIINRHLVRLCSDRISELRSALEEDPDYRLIRAQVQADECLARADAAYAGSDLPAARAALQQALQFTPDATPLLVCLGNLQFQLGEYAEALLLFQRASRQEPDNVDILVRLAGTARHCNDSAAFDQALDRAAALSPDEPNVIQLVASQNLRAGRYAEAARQYCALLERKPEDVSWLLALGKCLRQLRDVNSARWCYEQVLRLDPANAIARENLPALSTAAAPSASAHAESEPRPA